MNRPASNVRLLGSAGMAIPVAVVCAAIVLGWLQGSVPGLAAFVAVLALARTLAAVKEVRRYQAWSGQWQAMGASLNAPPQPAKKRGGGWQRVTAAVLLLLVIPAYLRQAEGTGGARHAARMALGGSVPLSGLETVQARSGRLRPLGCRWGGAGTGQGCGCAGRVAGGPRFILALPC